MPYSQDSEVPTYVPQNKRAQWREVWNSAHSAALKAGLNAEDAEAKAFREANGVAGPGVEKTASAPYGDVKYADPGHQEDKVKRYPVDTEEHIRAAWGYIHHSHDAAKYTPEQLASVKAEIVSAWKSKIDPSGPPEAHEASEKIAVIGFFPFSKNTVADASKRQISGIAASETPDRTGEIFDYEESKPHIKEWSDDIFKNSGGKSYGNVREMHTRGLACVGKIVSLFFNDLKKCVEVVVEIVDDAAWEKIEKGLYTGFSFGGQYAKKWKDAAMKYTRYAARPFELTLADYPCIPGANFTLAKVDGTRVEVLFTPQFPLDVTEVDGQIYELRWEKSATREETMTAEEKQALEKLQKDVAAATEGVSELRKVSEAHKAHLEAMAVHHQGMGHHLGSMIEDCNKIAKGEKVTVPTAEDLRKISGGGTVEVKAENGFISIGKTSDGVEIFKKAPADPNAGVLAAIEEMNKNFTGFVKTLHDGLAAAKGDLHGAVARPFVVGKEGRVMAKTADGTMVDVKEDDGKPITSTGNLKPGDPLLKTIFSQPLGGNEIEMIQTRAIADKQAAAGAR